MKPWKKTHQGRKSFFWTNVLKHNGAWAYSPEWNGWSCKTSTAPRQKHYTSLSPFPSCHPVLCVTLLLWQSGSILKGWNLILPGVSSKQQHQLRAEADTMGWQQQVRLYVALSAWSGFVRFNAVMFLFMSFIPQRSPATTVQQTLLFNLFIYLCNTLGQSTTPSLIVYYIS